MSNDENGSADNVGMKANETGSSSSNVDTSGRELGLWRHITKVVMSNSPKQLYFPMPFIIMFFGIAYAMPPVRTYALVGAGAFTLAPLWWTIKALLFRSEDQSSQDSES